MSGGEDQWAGEGVTEIRSYRNVFEFERRIYRIDRVRLNPAGVPLRGLVYFVVLLMGGLALARVPLLEVLARVLPWYLRDLAMPGLAAALFTIVKIEGRPFHLAVLALVRYGTCPRVLAGLRPYTASDRRLEVATVRVLKAPPSRRIRTARRRS